MARTAYGERVSLTETTVVYRFAVDDRIQWDGLLEIPLSDPFSATVVGSDSVPRSAGVVFVRAFEAFQTTGQWPEKVRHIS